ncbi:MAG: helicase [Verrucomicrobia bacterium]|nr:helicase [Verrucomicrobiota bacterium]
MSIFQQMMGNVTEFAPDKAQTEFAPILAEGEKVVKAFKLIRDQIILTNLRIITINKEGLTGSKHFTTSIPYKSIKMFAKESAGIFDLDAELRIWLQSESEPIKWEFSKGVDINEVYRTISTYVLKG